MPTFYEFFAGGGMARAGLGSGWECLFANDIDPKKGASYAANWGDERLRVADIGALTTEEIPARADLAWASFPCQDLSLAGNGAGLKGKRSGTFWRFWSHIEALVQQGRGPSLVVLENVCGALSSHDGTDFAATHPPLAGAGYRFGAVVIDAVHFVPQSRPRLFIVSVRRDRNIHPSLTTSQPNSAWRPPRLISAHEQLSPASKDAWLWWNLPTVPSRNCRFADMIENEPRSVRWHTSAETARLLEMMSEINRQKVELARRKEHRIVGSVYRRTRTEGGKRVQRAEIRFDDVAGCLRTPGGGSSRQSIMIMEGATIRSRLLSSREAARLMGLPDSYQLPETYNEAYHLAGDGVVVPVVRFLATHLLEPLLAPGKEEERVHANIQKLSANLRPQGYEQLATPQKEAVSRSRTRRQKELPRHIRNQR